MIVTLLKGVELKHYTDEKFKICKNCTKINNVGIIDTCQVVSQKKLLKINGLEIPMFARNNWLAY